ncbi:MAG TPA: alcohol dehydrogenase catalytic domain-containing protein [Vicinamibacteria bacterium]|nr:alcohol dehydrogenase catalytic domain-containing protein [Vicinamibacteria bacterium]
MRALWLQDGMLRVADDVPAPAPSAGEALVRVRLAGVCHTDLELVKGYAGFTGVPGHEFVGEVVAAPGADTWVGRRVVGEINVACGACRECAAGRRPHCETRTVLGIRGRHGAFAEYLTLPLANLHEVPKGVADEVAVFTEPVAAALEVQEQVRIGPDEKVVVVGAGRLGQLLARTLALTGCALRVGGRHPDKLALLARRGIAAGPVEALPERWADVAVECTGNPAGLERARRSVRPRGTIVLKSTYHGRPQVDLSAIVVDEITLVGSRCGPFAKAVALLASGRLDVSDLVTAVYPLHEAADAFAAASRPGMLKVLVRIGG